MNRILPTSMVGQRSDALLLVEYKGSGSNQLLPSAGAKTATNVGGTVPGNGTQGVSRGRY
jgi:hypothetical protein